MRSPRLETVRSRTTPFTSAAYHTSDTTRSLTSRHTRWRVRNVPAATLSVYAPTRLRGGLLWEARFHITAHQELKNAILELGTGWAEGMSINTIEPSPTGEASDNGKLEFTLGHIPKDQSFILYTQFQVNPTTVGHRSRSTWLYDGETELAAVHQKVTIFP